MERPRKPQLAKTKPEMFQAECAAANALDQWMLRRGVSNVELAELWCVSESIVRDLRTRVRPLRVAHVLMLPVHARRALLAILEVVDVNAA